MRRWARTAVLVPAAVVMAAALAPAAASGEQPARGTGGAHGWHHGDRLSIETVSNPRAELVSGGDVLVRVTGVDDRRRLSLRLGREDVTDVLVEQPDGSLVGLVDGLRDGRNLLWAHQGLRFDSLVVTNHDIAGPVLSGPQQTPFYCETEAFGLPAASQPDCSAPTQVSYVYRSGSTFKPLADPSAVPADAATATVDGSTVPYVVRVERGTIDRAVYEVAALYDGTDPTPTAPADTWNDRLVYTFGGGCNGGYHQGANSGGVLNDLMLSQGYVVASSSLNVLDNNCSHIISAEAAMMVKEHVVETYGAPAHTIGWGGSGGAIQQYAIADTYPGILDGIVPSIGFPDVVTTTGPVGDCRLLNRFYAGDGASWSAEEKRAVTGYLNLSSCQSWDLTFASRLTATESCPAVIPVDVRWDPVTNPDGLKCSAMEQFVNQVGRDPKTGFVRSATDNVGMQYGLEALEDGSITPEQFVALNESIGGYDVAGNVVAERSVADRKAVRASYRYGMVTSGGRGLAETPVIDLRTYADVAGVPANFHTAEWSFVIRQRMIEANGDADNQVIVAHMPLPDQTAAASADALASMDAWLTAIDGDTGRGSRADKVVRNKPGSLSDSCWVSASQRIPTDWSGTDTCGSVYPIGDNPRQVAGQPLEQDVVACALRPIRWRSYGVDFTAEQKARLRGTFDRGVCDYDAKPRGWAKALTWPTF
ncbi:hypothetical protein CLV56_1679 [Mumia flava]|uniref:DUF6351 domain-containing protein n=1 Tax=Mumia flava TaxID=1348852 RepID=A0A0B2BJ32_9ACTN|nr:DUF6351 family protein [Mumia flava]PJJ57448.1 hypothetical protein CLV56_1679 [Mumia flava]